MYFLVRLYFCLNACGRSLGLIFHELIPIKWGVYIKMTFSVIYFVPRVHTILFQRSLLAIMSAGLCQLTRVVNYFLPILMCRWLVLCCLLSSQFSGTNHALITILYDVNFAIYSLNMKNHAFVYWSLFHTCISHPVSLQKNFPGTCFDSL